MSTDRIFCSADFMQPCDGEPIRSVVTQTRHATVVAWHIKPGQSIAAHVHPDGQDTWTVLSGRGAYKLDKAGTTQELQAGDIAVAQAGELHGVTALGDEPFVFISVVCPEEAGYELM